MADGRFLGDFALRRKHGEEREARDRLRRDAAVDTCAGFAGSLVALAHAFAPWSPLFRVLGVPWLPFVGAVGMFLWGAFNAVDFVRLRRAERPSA